MHISVLHTSNLLYAVYPFWSTELYSCVVNLLEENNAKIQPNLCPKVYLQVF